LVVRDVVMRVRAISALLAVMVAAGCGELGPTTPQGAAGPQIVVESFSGTLPLRGVVFYSFTVETGGQTSLTLVDARENGVITEALITIGLGQPRGTQCLATNVLSVTSGGKAQVSGPTNKGVYCAVVFDPGNLTSDATFLVNIARPK
jgi:hypothetical protein